MPLRKAGKQEKKTRPSYFLRLVSVKAVSRGAVRQVATRGFLRPHRACDRGIAAPAGSVGHGRWAGQARASTTSPAGHESRTASGPRRRNRAAGSGTTGAKTLVRVHRLEAVLLDDHAVVAVPGEVNADGGSADFAVIELYRGPLRIGVHGHCTADASGHRQNANTCEERQGARRQAAAMLRAWRAVGSHFNLQGAASMRHSEFRIPSRAGRVSWPQDVRVTQRC